ncbi:MAG TPA: lipoprotein-releasing ABC transporter permease subunit [Pseudomonadales bacterium]|nr:lipoprotein-releasing ABC transporter permease subunit [Pseudomonadales bacterium]
MSNHFTPFVAIRYLTARKRSQWMSFISLVSTLGLVLGVASLITVLSVMNGFGLELKQRLLSTLPHAYAEPLEGAVMDWPSAVEQWQRMPGVVSAAPVISRKVMLVSGGLTRAINLHAVDPLREQAVSSLPSVMTEGNFEQLEDGLYGIVIGSVTAQQLGVFPGQRIDVILPQLNTTALGVFPRTKRFVVVGIFEAGAQVDGSEAFIALGDGRRLFRYSGDSVAGLRLSFSDMFIADQLPPLDGWQKTTWTQSNATLFGAIAMEKMMMTFLLLIVVTVATFNVVSIMSMLVNDKRADIAVMRVMGASSRTIRRIFMTTGLLIGMLGSALGCLLGVLLALNIGGLVSAVERALGASMFDPSVYYISQLPSHLLWSDVGLVLIVSLVLSVLSSYYPAKRAATIEPSRALQYE